MKKVKLDILIILIFILLTSCTIRTYEINFNYNVGNNGYDITEFEEYQKEIAQAEDGIIKIPQGSGNLVINIYAEVPKHIETQADAEVAIPLLP